MQMRDITIQVPNGNLNQAITFFIQKANEFQSEIVLLQDGVRINAKSLLGLLCMGLHQDSEVVVGAEGADADAALDALAQVLGG